MVCTACFRVITPACSRPALTCASVSPEADVGPVYCRLGSAASLEELRRQLADQTGLDTHQVLRRRPRTDSVLRCSAGDSGGSGRRRGEGIARGWVQMFVLEEASLVSKDEEGSVVQNAIIALSVGCLLGFFSFASQQILTRCRSMEYGWILRIVKY